jgi:phosphohistidine phosphatase
MRHAKANFADSAGQDHARTLNGRGRRAAPVMGELLGRSGVAPDYIITSTAARALETAQAVAEAVGYDGPVTLMKSLYLAEPQAYLEALLDVPARAQIVLMVGHNPGISDLVELLSGEPREMPTAAIAALELPLSEFSAISPETRGQLTQFWRPRDV